MSETHDPAEAIGEVTHYFSHLQVAGIRLTSPLGVGERIHIRGHVTDLIETVHSMEIDHRRIEQAVPGDDVAIDVSDHVREKDLIFLEL